MNKANHVLSLLEADDYYYHMTSSYNMEGIYNKGLIPSKETHWGGDLGASSIGKVFLGKERSHAEYYGNILKRDVDPEEGIHYFMLRVKRSNLKNANEDPQDKDTVFVTKPVPPSVIEVEWGEHGWKNLKSIDLNSIKGVSTGEWDEPENEFEPEEE